MYNTSHSTVYLCVYAQALAEVQRDYAVGMPPRVLAAGLAADSSLLPNFATVPAKADMQS